MLKVTKSVETLNLDECVIAYVDANNQRVSMSLCEALESSDALADIFNASAYDTMQFLNTLMRHKTCKVHVTHSYTIDVQLVQECYTRNEVLDDIDENTLIVENN